MSAPPKTVLTASPEEAASIRDAVRTADPGTLRPPRLLADHTHVGGLVALLSDPAVSDPVYDLPRPINADTVAAWIAQAGEERERGEGLLFVTVDGDGAIAGYSKVTVWPEHSSAELGGALRASLQSGGAGGAGAQHSIDWMFRMLEVRLICVTAALDNVRSARLVDRMGFTRMGERDSVRADGTIRRSLYWEMRREDWKRE